MEGKKDFSLMIESIVLEKKISYMDAIVWYCEENELEIEVAAKLLNTKIKQTIEAEASELNMMKEKNNVLPI